MPLIRMITKHCFTLKSLSSIRKIKCRNFNNVAFEDIPSVTPAVIKRTLSGNNVSFQEGHTCFMIDCPLCSKKPKQSLYNLYINKTTGSFSCGSCLSFGPWMNLEKYFNVKKSKRAKDASQLSANCDLDSIKQYIDATEHNSVLLRTLSDSALTKVWKSFKLPIVPHSAIEQVDVRIDPSKTFLYFPLQNVNLQTVGYRVLQKKDDIVDYQIEPSSISPTGILSGKSSKSKDTAILVPNVSDFLVLLNAKLTNYIVCLPNGAKHLPQQILPSLERFNKLILWFGNDISSWDSARNFARKLGEKRCLFVRPTENQPLPHLAVDKDLKAIASSAHSIWHKSITTFSSLREDVFSELQNVDKVHGVKWKRFPTLNRILKGHRRGELTVITGPTGCGKTTFISEYSLDLSMQGVNTLWGSFEIRNVRLAKTMLQQLAGLQLDQHLQSFETFADEFERLPIYYMTFHGQQSVKIVMEAVEHAQYVHDITHVVIDNVQFMMGMGDEQKHIDRFWMQDLIIASFRTFATRRNCHVSLVIHPRKERDTEDLTTSSIFGGAKASQEADNILIIQDKRLTSVRGKKYLQISKNRYSGDLGIMPLDFDKNSLSFAQKKKKDLDEKSVDEPAESTVIN